MIDEDKNTNVLSDGENPQKIMIDCLAQVMIFMTMTLKVFYDWPELMMNNCNGINHESYLLLPKNKLARPCGIGHPAINFFKRPGTLMACHRSGFRGVAGYQLTVADFCDLKRTEKSSRGERIRKVGARALTFSKIYSAGTYFNDQGHFVTNPDVLKFYNIDHVHNSRT